jgi:hypothetical protein
MIGFVILGKLPGRGESIDLRHDRVRRKRFLTADDFKKNVEVRAKALTSVQIESLAVVVNLLLRNPVTGFGESRFQMGTVGDDARSYFSKRVRLALNKASKPARAIGNPTNSSL